ncbi:Polysaccharide biosynthesis protein [compost metagenome]|uniref:oligosaccharide flippase family protein n=1 Tax=Variovorax boronicumulans TaxID=436515 RepID=UPI000F9DCD19|nr:oligosaccharide flippase family protein [Variovorax boronicumulans]
MKNSGLAEKAFWSLLSQISSRGSLMLSAIILTRSLDPHAFASYSYFQLTVSMLSAYAAMGLGVTSSRYFSEVGHERSGQELFPLGVLWGLSILFALAAFIFLILMPGRWLSAGLLIPQWLLALGVLALTLEIVPGGAILGLEKYKQASLISVFSGGLMILGACVASRNATPSIAMGSIVLAAFLQGVGETFIVIRAVGWRRIATRAHSIGSSIGRVLVFAGPMLLVSLMAASGSWLLGRLILLTPGGAHAFAMYSIGLQWFAFVLVLPGMVSRVLLPRVVRNANASVEEQRALIWQGIRMAGTTALVVALIGLILAPEIMKIYGAQYDGGRWFLGGYLLAAVLIAPANTIGNAIVASNGQKQWLGLTAVWLGVLISVGVIMLLLGGVPGSMALAGAAVVQTTLAFYIARSRNLI